MSNVQNGGDRAEKSGKSTCCFLFTLSCSDALSTRQGRVLELRVTIHRWVRLDMIITLDGLIDVIVSITLILLFPSLFISHPPTCISRASPSSDWALLELL
jgi:hypothetical protein